MKNGAQGMSKIAKSTGEPAKRCTASRSLSPDAGLARSFGWTERRSIARNTRASSRACAVAPMRAA
ncbi:hypothetical protein CNY89_14215, partial [Amaricoccus sp. HAR-UPW-R2A-40]